MKILGTMHSFVWWDTYQTNIVVLIEDDIWQYAGRPTFKKIWATAVCFYCISNSTIFASYGLTKSVFPVAFWKTEGREGFLTWKYVCLTWNQRTNNFESLWVSTTNEPCQLVHLFDWDPYILRLTKHQTCKTIKVRKILINYSRYPLFFCSYMYVKPTVVC